MSKSKNFPINYKYNPDYIFAHELHSRPGNLFYKPQRFLSPAEFQELKAIDRRYTREFNKRRRNRRPVNCIMVKWRRVYRALNAINPDWRPQTTPPALPVESNGRL